MSLIDTTKATKQQLRRALAQASLSLQAIGHPEPHDPPDAHICGVMARGALVRVTEALEA